MRQIGTLKSADEAQRFAAYLVTQGISAEAEPEGDNFTIWVKNEDQVSSAKEALAHFLQAPSDPRYQGAESRAAAMEQASRKEREKARGNVVDIRSRWQRNTAGGFRAAPLTFVLIALSVFVYLSGATGNPATRSDGYLQFCSPLKSFGARGARWPLTRDGQIDSFYDIRQGQVWRLVTPIFVHFSITHIVFNMLMLHALGRRIEARYGAWRMALLVLTIAIVSNVGQILWNNNPSFGGMSGVVYGLFGFMWVKAAFFPDSNLWIDNFTVAIMMGWMFLCVAAEVSPETPSLEVFRGVANGAHVVGFATGLAVAAAPLLWQRR